MSWCARISLTLLMFSLPLFAQNDKDHLSATILHEDGQFWDAYNRCDVEKMSEFFWPDIEFYHDKGGPTIGAGPLLETIKKNLCGNPNSHLRREEVPGTAKAFPLEQNGPSMVPSFTASITFTLTTRASRSTAMAWRNISMSGY